MTSPDSVSSAAAEPPSPPSRPAGGRGGAWFTGLVGLAFVVGAAVFMFGLLPASRADHRDYTAATACPVEEPGKPRASREPDRDCLAESPAVVVRTESGRRGRSTYRYLFLTAPPSPTASVAGDGAAREFRLEMSSGSPVFGAVTAGDRVRVTYWRGEARSVAFGHLRQGTGAVPGGARRLFLAAGLAMLMLGAAFLWGGYWWARRSADSPALDPWQIRVPTGAFLCLAGAGAVAAFATDSVPAVLMTTVVAALVIAVPTVLIIRRRLRRTTDTMTVVPRVPEGERCLRALVLGDVPYSVDGFDHLVIGPGLLAATPDPTGRVARRRLPSSLTPVRVRPPYRTDPGAAALNGLRVVECRDGTTPVVIAATADDVPWILGALRSRDADASQGRDGFRAGER
ncbi:hypothetical protein [Streptomyces sp. NPDC014734]|uniref:hypothetical protein n=1 Tax=Streptomyces sp. NPDC014734 TaxID=3364886 RepID=UPI0036FC9B4D